MFNVIPFYLSKLIKYKIKSRFEIKERKKKFHLKEFCFLNIQNVTLKI